MTQGQKRHAQSGEIRLSDYGVNEDPRMLAGRWALNRVEDARRLARQAHNAWFAAKEDGDLMQARSCALAALAAAEKDFEFIRDGADGLVDTSGRKYSRLVAEYAEQARAELLSTLGEMSVAGGNTGAAGDLAS